MSIYYSLNAIFFPQWFRITVQNRYDWRILHGILIPSNKNVPAFVHLCASPLYMCAYRQTLNASIFNSNISWFKILLCYCQLQQDISFFGPNPCCWKVICTQIKLWSWKNESIYLERKRKEKERKAWNIYRSIVTTREKNVLIRLGSTNKLKQENLLLKRKKG